MCQCQQAGSADRDTVINPGSIRKAGRGVGSIGWVRDPVLDRMSRRSVQIWTPLAESCLASRISCLASRISCLAPCSKKRRASVVLTFSRVHVHVLLLYMHHRKVGLGAAWQAGGIHTWHGASRPSRAKWLDGCSHSALCPPLERECPAACRGVRAPSMRRRCTAD